ncbi:MAG: mandelate racemase/muconate lactonizing enzyme family protein [Candidatus Bathyarchaeia archaeon]
MQIVRVETAVVRVPVHPGSWNSPEYGPPEWDELPIVLVRLTTDEGIVGIGETRGGGRAERTIKGLKPKIIGEDPTNLNRIQQLLGLQPDIQVRSGLDIACWDILGKALGVPIYRLLGGKYRDRVRMYADSGGPVGWGLGSPDPEAFANRARNVLRKGFDAMKVDVDMPAHSQPGFDGALKEAEVALMERQVEAIRDVIGDEMPLAIDCHGKFSPTSAVKVANRLSRFKPWWLEDPVPFADLEGLSEVRSQTDVPISVGEVFPTRLDFRELIRRNAASILGPDSITTGGLTEFRRIAELAEVYRLPVSPHNMTTPVATVATAHVCAALPNFVALEHHFQDFDWWDNLVEEGPVIKDGYIAVPEKPGIGLNLNEPELLKHLRPGEDSIWS